MRRIDNAAIRHKIPIRTNRGLIMVLEGGNTALESIINQRQVGMIATRIGKGNIPDHRARPATGSPQREMNRHLEENGLDEVSHWYGCTGNCRRRTIT